MSRGRGSYRGGSRGGGGGYRGGGSTYNNRGNSGRSSTYHNNSSSLGGGSDRYGNGYDNFESRGSTSRSSYQNSSSGDRYRDSYKRSSAGYEGGHSRDHRTPERKRPRIDFQDSRRSHDNYGGGSSGGGYHGRNNHYESSSSFDYHQKRNDNRPSHSRNSPPSHHHSPSSKYRRDNSSSSRRSRDRMGPPPQRSTNVRRPFRGRPLHSRGTSRLNRATIYLNSEFASINKRKRYLATTPRSREMLRRLKLARRKSRRELGLKSLARNGKTAKNDEDDEDWDEDEKTARKSSSGSPKKKVSKTSTSTEKDGADEEKNDIGGDDSIQVKDEGEEEAKKLAKSSSEKTVSEAGDTAKAEKATKSDGDADKKKSTKSRSSNSRADKSSPPKNYYTGKAFVKLTCVHCNVTSVTFKEYIKHLQRPKHNEVIRHVSKKQKRALHTMRIEQRQAQREIEDTMEDRNAETQFCLLCRLNYRQPKLDHQMSDGHKKMKKFLMPFCRICKMGFRSPIAYEAHRCSLEHLKKKGRKGATKSDSGGEEANEKDIDLESFMTVDSVGDVDDGADKSTTDMDTTTTDDSDGKIVNVGSEHVKKIETYYCELCRYYLPHHEDRDESLKRHCRNRSHLKAYLVHKDDRNLRKAAELLHKRRQDKPLAAKDTDMDKSIVDENASKETAEGGEGEFVKVTETSESNDKVAEEGGKEIDPPSSSVPTSSSEQEGKESEKESEGGRSDKAWADVDKELGDLLRVVNPESTENDDEDEEDSRLNNERYDRFKTGEKTSSDERDTIDEENGAPEEVATKIQNGN